MTYEQFIFNGLHYHKYSWEQFLFMVFYVFFQNEVYKEVYQVIHVNKNTEFDRLDFVY